MKALGQVAVAELKHPSRDLLPAGKSLHRAAERVVEIAAHNHIVALFPLLSQHAAQQLQLGRAHGAALVISGHMAVDQHQLAAARHRKALYGKAAVQIKKLRREALVHRIAAPLGLRHRIAGQSEQPRLHAAVHLVERIGKIGGVEIGGKHRPILGKGLPHHL